MIWHKLCRVRFFSKSYVRGQYLVWAIFHHYDICFCDLVGIEKLFQGTCMDCLKLYYEHDNSINSQNR